MSDPRARRRTRFVAAARELNRHPRLLGATKRTRERVLGDDELVERVSSVRARPADLVARELVAFRAEQPGVLGELGLTALQAWQRLAEAQGRGRGQLDVAILFTDLVGFSSWALGAGDEHALELLRQVRQAIEPPMRDRGGEIVKRLGDGLMGAFWDAAGATEAAFAAGERVAAITVDGYRPRLRTGIHLGRPRRIGGDYLGVDVNIAARLAEAAAPGEVLVSGHTLAALDPATVSVSERSFSAKGTPAELTAHVVAALAPVDSQRFRT